MQKSRKACNGYGYGEGRLQYRQSLRSVCGNGFSPKSLKEIKFNCYKNGIKLYSLGMTMDDIHFGLGKRTGVVAICEGGFAKACAKGLEEIPIDENEFYSI